MMGDGMVDEVSNSFLSKDTFSIIFRLCISASPVCHTNSRSWNTKSRTTSEQSKPKKRKDRCIFNEVHVLDVIQNKLFTKSLYHLIRNKGDGKRIGAIFGTKEKTFFSWFTSGKFINVVLLSLISRLSPKM